MENNQQEPSFGETIKRIYKNSFDFKGRATKQEAKNFEILFSYMGVACVILKYLELNIYYQLIFGILMFILSIPGISLTVRRLHDVNHSGWRVVTDMAWIIASIGVILLGCFICMNISKLIGIPVFIVGTVWLLILVLRCNNLYLDDSYPQPNKWGNVPFLIDDKK